MDHPQKLLLMGEAQDYGNCQAMKKNGDPCSQIVNMVGPSCPAEWVTLALRPMLPSGTRGPTRLTVSVSSAVRMPVLPVSRQGPVQADELEEGRAAIGVFRQSSQQVEGEGQQPAGASVSGRLLLRRRVVGRLRHVPVSHALRCHVNVYSRKHLLSFSGVFHKPISIFILSIEARLSSNEPCA